MEANKKVMSINSLNKGPHFGSEPLGRIPTSVAGIVSIRSNENAGISGDTQTNPRDTGEDDQNGEEALGQH